MNKHPTWQPATIADPQPDPDPRAKPIEYVMVDPDELRRRRFESFAAGLLVVELQPSDLTESERRAFGIIGGEA